MAADNFSVFGCIPRVLPTGRCRLPAVMQPIHCMRLGQRCERHRGLGVLLQPRAQRRHQRLLILERRAWMVVEGGGG